MVSLGNLKDLGFEKERATLAQLCLSFFVVMYLLMGLNGPDGYGPLFLALGAHYLTAFLALGSQWFWGRWFAAGLGWYGAFVGIASLVMMGWHPMLVIYAGLHVAVVLVLMGPRVAARFELQPDWQQRFAMDDIGVARLGKSVTRASASLPSLLMWALAPGDGEGSTLLACAALAFGATGLWALVRLRTVALLLLGAGALASLAVVAISSGGGPVLLPGVPPVLAESWGAAPGGANPPALAGAGFLFAALAPLAGPTLRFLRRG
jgi:hypothetical protein